ILDASVSVLVLEGNQSCGFPGAEPGGHGAVLGIADGIEQVHACECCHRRRRTVEDDNKEQGITSRFPGCAYAWYGEEANDDMRQSGSPQHQGGGHAHHIEGAAYATGIRGKPEFLIEAIEALQQISTSKA